MIISLIKKGSILLFILLFTTISKGQVKSTVVSELKKDSVSIISMLDNVIDILNFTRTKDSDVIRIAAADMGKSNNNLYIKFYQYGFRNNLRLENLYRKIDTSWIFYYRNRKFVVKIEDERTKSIFSRYFQQIGLEKTSEMTELYDMQSPFIDIDIILLDTKFYIEKITIEYPIINKIIE